MGYLLDRCNLFFHCYSHLLSRFFVFGILSLILCNISLFLFLCIGHWNTAFFNLLSRYLKYSNSVYVHGCVSELIFSSLWRIWFLAYSKHFSDRHPEVPSESEIILCGTLFEYWICHLNSEFEYVWQKKFSFHISETEINNS